MRTLAALLLLTQVALGAPAPSFQADSLGGTRLSLKESLKPGRALLVCFWASWCGPCLEELRHVADQLKADPSLPLDVVSVNVDTPETASDIKPTVRLHKIGFPVALDPTHEIFAKYNATKTLPFSVLVSPSGEVAAQFTGYQEGMFAKVRALVAKGTK